MVNYADIVTGMFKTISDAKISENMQFFRVAGKALQPIKEIKELFTKATNFLSGDEIILTISDNDSPFSYESTNSEQDNQNNFFNKWKELVEDDDGTTSIDYSIVITKKWKSECILSIYSPKYFWIFLSGLEIIKLLELFSKTFKVQGDNLFFLLPEGEIEFNTESLHFITDINRVQELRSPINHALKWERIKSISYFSSLPDCRTLPEDFLLKSTSSVPTNIQNLFSQAATTLELVVIHDLSSVNNTKFEGKLNGYKTFQTSVEIPSVTLSLSELYLKIYMWITEEGNLTDKTGLARNIISLNLTNPIGFLISDFVLQSILSAHTVYQKQNIKQYIELRNKMSDQLMSFNEKASKIVETFASNFHKSSLAVGSLFATFIITRVLTGTTFINVFTRDATLIAIAFLLVSVIYFFVSRWEILTQRKRFIDSYSSMKNRNKDLLNEDDINQILNNDVEYNNDLNFIDGKTKKYSMLWIGSIIIFSLFILVLFACYTMS